MVKVLLWMRTTLLALAAVGLLGGGRDWAAVVLVPVAFGAVAFPFEPPQKALLMVAGATLNATVFTYWSLHQTEMTATTVLGLTIGLNFIGLWMRVGAIRRQTQA